MGLEDIPEPARSIELEQAFAALESIRAAEDAERHYDQPDEYDAQKEDQVRGLMELTAFYDEAGPRADPEGNYLCGTCCMREEPNGCLFVEGRISMTEGSCNLYVIGAALKAEDFALKEKFTRFRAGYAERPEAKAFGCQRCSYAEEAQEEDEDGRTLWCREWGVHVLPTACCARHEGPDQVTPGA